MNHVTSSTAPNAVAKKRLTVMNDGPAPDLDLDAELRAFEDAERVRLGLEAAPKQWVEDMANLTFTKTEKKNITLLVGGLTLAQDFLVEGGLKGVGYNVKHLPVPDSAAFQMGKEFGNRGQCNPTYFTVGALVQALVKLRDEQGLTAKQIVDDYVFLTAGACGPCRFGMYVTEYRKALRDAGFDGFRVVLFQQTGGVKQATGDASGLELNPAFFWALAKALFIGDVINAMGYRLRPYEVEAGSTDAALEASKKVVYDALANDTNVLVALVKVRRILSKVKVDRLVAKPKVSIIGEFWAMTTEGDGNYQLQRFLEGEGAECDIQLLAAWVLYMLWEARHDTKDRADLREPDFAKYGLGELGPWGVAQRLVGVEAGEIAVRSLFQVFANLAGLHGYKLPDMNEIAAVADQHYNNDLRGGEGHMEVGKLIVNVTHNKAHMTLSVKPFGCMPSASVSDGVQSAITERYPGSIYCPVETSGDGRVNFYSRVQMYLFKAKQSASGELERALETHGVTLEQVRATVAKRASLGHAFHKSPHAYAGTAADLVAEVAPYVTLSRLGRAKARLAAFAPKAKVAAERTPHVIVELFQTATAKAPDLARRVALDLTLFRELRAEKKRAAATGSSVIDAAAE